MMLPHNAIAVAIALLVTSLLGSGKAISLPGRLEENFTSTPLSSASSWLRKVNNHGRQRLPGCWGRPRICREEDHHDPERRRMRCCRNQCVDVWSDVNNCGLCGIRCPFAWQCCRGFCVNTNFSPWNCGRCGNGCLWGVRCVYGMCGYAQPPPPWPRPRPPFPFPPLWPCPPFPFPPRPPRPPHPLSNDRVPPAMSQSS